MSLSSDTKVIPLLKCGKVYKERTDSITIRIYNTKKEWLLKDFGNSSSDIRRLCRIASEDRCLRTLFFLKTLMASTLRGYRPVVINIPITFSSSRFDASSEYKSVEAESEREPEYERIKELKRRRDEIVENTAKISMTGVAKILSTLLRRYSSRIAQRRPLKEEKIMEDVMTIFKEKEDEFRPILVNYVKHSQEVLSFVEYYEPLISAWRKLPGALLNWKILRSCGFSNVDVSKALEKIAQNDVMDVEIQSVCLDCIIKASLPKPFIDIQKNTRKPRIERQCSQCGGDFIVHDIMLHGDFKFRYLMSPRILQEFIIAYSLEKIDKIEKIYVHKKIQIGNQKSVEGDLFGVTDSQEFFLIEVTTQTDVNELLKYAHDKIKNLRDAGLLNYLKTIIVVSPSPMEQQMLSISEEESPTIKLMGIKSLCKLEELFEKMISS